MNINNRSLLTLCGLLVSPTLIVAQATDSPAETPAADIVSEDSPVIVPDSNSGTVDTMGEVVATPAEENSDGAPVVESSGTELSPLSVDAEAPRDALVVISAAETEMPKDTLSVDFPDEDVRNILRNVADLFELNIVVPDTLQGRTSIKLRDVTWRQIFKVVLSPLGYTTVEEGNIIKVVTVESLALEPLVTEVFVLNYSRAEEIVSSILPLVDSAGGGRVLVDKRINALIISERPSKMVKITPVLESLDKATEQVMIESKFIEVTDNNERDLGLRWSTNGGVTAGAGQQAVDSRANSTPYTAIGEGAVPAGTTSVPGYSYSTAVLSSLELAATLEALETKTDSRVVSNPTVVTLNNTQAEINVGQEYPIPNYTYNAERGEFEVSGFEYKPIGVLLKVTPQVNAQGFIRLNLEPEISDFDPAESVNFGGAAGAEIPVIQTKKTKTQVSMKDGHTLAIGGLMSGGDSTIVRKVPILGDIPGVGRLFQSKSKTKSNNNLLIFITARLVNAESAAVRDIFSAEQVHSVGLRRSDLPGIRRSDDEGFFLPEKVPSLPDSNR